jgi:hypothetical protein
MDRPAVGVLSDVEWRERPSRCRCHLPSPSATTGMGRLHRGARHAAWLGTAAVRSRSKYFMRLLFVFECTKKGSSASGASARSAAAHGAHALKPLASHSCSLLASHSLHLAVWAKSMRAQENSFAGAIPDAARTAHATPVVIALCARRRLRQPHPAQHTEHQKQKYPHQHHPNPAVGGVGYRSTARERAAREMREGEALEGPRYNTE